MQQIQFQRIPGEQIVVWVGADQFDPATSLLVITVYTTDVGSSNS